jgi:hypothetical protein
MGGILSGMIIVDQAGYDYPPLKDVQQDFICQWMVMLGFIMITGRQCTGGGRKPANKQVVLSDDGSLPKKLPHQAHIVALPQKA